MCVCLFGKIVSPDDDDDPNNIMANIVPYCSSSKSKLQLFNKISSTQSQTHVATRRDIRILGREPSWMNTVYRKNEEAAS
jgi:hypothetical protein